MFEVRVWVHYFISKRRSAALPYFIFSHGCREKTPVVTTTARLGGNPQNRATFLPHPPPSLPVPVAFHISSSQRTPRLPRQPSCARERHCRCADRLRLPAETSSVELVRGQRFGHAEERRATALLRCALLLRMAEPLTPHQFH